MVSGDNIEAMDLALPAVGGTDGHTLQDGRARYEKGLIFSKLQASGWNVSQAARELGVERSHLYRKMKAYGISKTEAQ